MSNYMEDYTQAEETRIEKEIISAVASCLLKAGFTIALEIDGEGVITRARTAKEVLAGIDEYFASNVYFTALKGKETKGFVRFVMGNVGDVISDYSTSLEPIIKPALETASKYD